MITIISPATTMSFDRNVDIKSSKPFFDKDIKKLINLLKSLDPVEIGNLMNLSDDLANLNYDRYKILGTDKSNYLQAILAFDGQVFN